MPDLLTLRAAADTLFPVRGGWAYDAWQAINRRFWDGALRPGPILWGLTAGCSFGAYNPNNNAITLHEALPGRDFAAAARDRGESDWVMANRDQPLNSWGRDPEHFGVGTALCTLLHETMHQAHHQRGLTYPPGRKPFTLQSHHNAVWAAECERIAGMIGLPGITWPIYVERKEKVEEVRERLGFAGDQLTAAELYNRRRWKWIATVDGEEVEPGPGIAQPEELTGFPRQTFEYRSIAVADRVALVLADC